MKATLEAAADAMHGQLEGRGAAYSGVSTDTRSLERGNLFFALKGPNFDGADYVARAGQQGAAGAVVTARVDCDLPQVIVADTRAALTASPPGVRTWTSRWSALPAATARRR